MSSCCPHARSAGRFFSFFAHRYRKRFKKKGFEPSQQQLIAGLEQVGYRDATVLEIGCGVGHLHQSLLEQGADSAVGIDLASSMLAEARDWAGERGLTERTDYIEGDFMLVADQVDPADISLLDKVVCCYPDAHRVCWKNPWPGRTRDCSYLPEGSLVCAAWRLGNRLCTVDRPVRLSFLRSRSGSNRTLDHHQRHGKTF